MQSKLLKNRSFNGGFACLLIDHEYSQLILYRRSLNVACDVVMKGCSPLFDPLFVRCTVVILYLSWMPAGNLSFHFQQPYSCLLFLGTDQEDAVFPVSVSNEELRQHVRSLYEDRLFLCNGLHIMEKLRKNLSAIAEEAFKEFGR